MKFATAALFLFLTTFSFAAPKVLVIGDSLSEEYSFEIPFSAPENDPFDANTANWIETLDEHRSGLLNFGSYASSIPHYLDVRNAGFSYNWSIPGADSHTWNDVVNSTLFNQPGYLTSRIRLEDQLDDMDVAVIFVGGNDVRALYGKLYDNIPPANWITDIVDNLEEVIDFIKGENSSLPIILCTIPDVGATPSKQASHPDPAIRQVAAAHMVDLNAAVAQLAANEGAQIADIAKLTSDILKQEDYYIGATLMIKGSHPNNEPLYLFCRDGFHPATAAQATIANTILEQINIATNSAIDPLTNREIIGDVLDGLDPDQPYLDWIAGFSLADAGMLDDPDKDGIPNIGEYALGTAPNMVSNPYSFEVSNIASQPHFQLSYSTSPEALRLVSVINEDSSNLTDWDELPLSNLIDLGSGNFQVQAPTSTRKFYRQQFYLNE